MGKKTIGTKATATAVSEERSQAATVTKETVAADASGSSTDIPTNPESVQTKEEAKELLPIAPTTGSDPKGRLVHLTGKKGKYLVEKPETATSQTFSNKEKAKAYFDHLVSCSQNQ